MKRLEWQESSQIHLRHGAKRPYDHDGIILSQHLRMPVFFGEFQNPSPESCTVIWKVGAVYATCQRARLALQKAGMLEPYTMTRPDRVILRVAHLRIRVAHGFVGHT